MSFTAAGRTRYAYGTYSAGRGLLGRAKRQSIVRRRQRALIRAGLRTVAPRRFRAMNPRTGGYMGIEYKFLDCAWNGVTINATSSDTAKELQPSTGCTQCISVPAQGDGESERDGRKWTVKSIFLSGVIDTATSSDQVDAFEDHGVYMALVLDTQANGATLTSENVYKLAGTSVRSMLPQPLRNLQYSKRYRVLAHTYIRPQGMYAMADGVSTASISAQTGPHVKLSWKGNIICEANGTTANVANATDNAIHVYAVTAAGTAKGFYGKSRMRFVG